ncbi:hypothetical protein [Agromyces ramosus]|uniref:YjbR protein n=1 Tax=Agromyces ramosus TaxID=33879 RepID=A0ABU0R932_9MICO|nr:hypothetical protein [Agromyces ramosus]MDQ0894590.1 hypothetical protein [Agromyces ramosus]
MDEAEQTYEAVTRELLLDEDLDVDETPDGLLVRGRLFAFLDGSHLVVELPEARSADLRRRGIATAFSGAHGGPSRNWIRVGDRELWSELAHEAHEYVGEPPVGRES